MRCQICGFENAPGAERCVKCGDNLSLTPQAEPTVAEIIRATDVALADDPEVPPVKASLLDLGATSSPRALEIAQIEYAIRLAPAEVVARLRGSIVDRDPAHLVEAGRATPADKPYIGSVTDDGGEILLTTPDWAHTSLWASRGAHTRAIFAVPHFEGRLITASDGCVLEGSWVRVPQGHPVPSLETFFADLFPQERITPPAR